MNCPKCDGEMARVSVDSIEVNRCTGCAGLWFDMLELEHLKAIAGSDEIDVGDPAIGHSHDSVTQVDCPVCHTHMVRMVDALQPRIHYESCSVCYGLFLDAGELHDITEKTVFNRFRELLSRRPG